VDQHGQRKDGLEWIAIGRPRRVSKTEIAITAVSDM
jgi:hypothetical protein